MKILAKWVNVNDKLPEKEGWYLACIEFGDGKHKRIDVVHFDTEDMYFNYFWSHNIRFWMPLPEPAEESVGDTE